MSAAARHTSWHTSGTDTTSQTEEPNSLNLWHACSVRSKAVAFSVATAVSAAMAVMSVSSSKLKGMLVEPPCGGGWVGGW